MGDRGRAPFSLLASWVAWWAILAIWKVGAAVPAILRVSKEGAKGDANVMYDDGGFSARISEGGKVAWEGHISLLTLVLLVGVPPLILWAIWLRRHVRSGPPDLIGEGAVDAGRPVSAQRATEDERLR